ncbi:MAG TPA: hypothetical protein VN936_08630 [Candidatus Acidoferrum sp.]|jgi:hypothetical protein|nr:hypothetical protein [Candidatus Acidoferrum sp.]
MDNRTIAHSIADGLNGIVRATRAFAPTGGSPQVERWKSEMTEASRHVLLAFGIDPSQLNNPSIPCGNGWSVDWVGGEGGQWEARQESTG